MDLPVTVPMLKLHNTNKHQIQTYLLRKMQTNWFSEPITLRQDQDLLDYISHHSIQSVTVYGDKFLADLVQSVANGPVDLIVWVQNEPFEFNQLVASINQLITTCLVPKGKIYISLNKYLVLKPELPIDCDEDYDHTMVKYMTSNINARLQMYNITTNHDGMMFYWIHPLTRFYFET